MLMFLSKLIKILIYIIIDLKEYDYILNKTI